MKKLLLMLIAVIMFAYNLSSQNIRGCTYEIQTKKTFTVVGQAKEYSPVIKEESLQNNKTGDNKGWELIDSININSYIQAGKCSGVKFDKDNHNFEVISDHGELTANAISALEKTPKWIRLDLQNVFSGLTAANQDKWAAVINNTENPYVDEIAFTIAHSSTAYLSSEYSYTQLFEENAELIYSHDIDLAYVEVIDYGTSATDENYYSTTRYRTMNDAKDTVWVEAPKEIYYWNVVLPKITDEIPAYINPVTIENTHTDNITDPSTGKFWRDYLYSSADAGYPILKDSLMDCPILWDDSSTIDSATNNAIATITNWAKASMEFTSDSERPHQPVRIYKKHIGRCGEWSDLTSAAARAALIPSTSILSMSGDHIWNEFWDEGWFHWEPVNTMINVPLRYENGWGWNFASVFEIRSDECLFPVTDKYSEGSATINIYALDNNDVPIDGARILLAVLDGTSIYVDNYGYTDNEGKYTFIVGEGKHYYARMDSDIGGAPTSASSVYSLMDSSVDGQTYNFNLPSEGAMPAVSLSSVSPPADSADDFLMVFEFAAQNQIVTGNTIMDDLDNCTFYDKKDNASTNFVILNPDNYSLYTGGNAFDGFHDFEDALSGSASFDIPAETHWYALLDNSNNLNNPQIIEGSILLYRYSDIGIISSSVNPAEGGTITGDGTYNCGETAELTATAATAYTFINWTENGAEVSTDATYSFTVSEDRTLVANFSDATSVTDIDNDIAFNVYPNPATDIITFETYGKNNFTYKIVNTTGVVVMQGVIDENKKQLDISQVPFGTYMISVDDGTATETIRFIKQ